MTSETGTLKRVGIYGRLAAARAKGRVICVTGGRHYNNRSIVDAALDTIHAANPISLLIEGGAVGADRLCRSWAVHRGVEFHTEEALWALMGPSAGPHRNTVMADMKPDLVVAFPGGWGTRDMVVKAVSRGIHVVHITDLG